MNKTWSFWDKKFTMSYHQKFQSHVIEAVILPQKHQKAHSYVCSSTSLSISVLTCCAHCIYRELMTVFSCGSSWSWFGRWFCFWFWCGWRWTTQIFRNIYTNVRFASASSCSVSWFCHIFLSNMSQEFSYVALSGFDNRMIIFCTVSPCTVVCSMVAYLTSRSKNGW